MEIPFVAQEREFAETQKAFVPENLQSMTIYFPENKTKDALNEQLQDVAQKEFLGYHLVREWKNTDVMKNPSAYGEPTVYGRQLSVVLRQLQYGEMVQHIAVIASSVDMSNLFRTNLMETIRKECSSKSKNAKCPLPQTNPFDFMAMFNPKYGKTGWPYALKKNINVKQVSNSHFDLWVQSNFSHKHPAVTLAEYNLQEIAKNLPKDFQVPRIVVIDFEKNDFPKTAAGYFEENKTIYINASLDSVAKIKRYMSKNPG